MEGPTPVSALIHAATMVTAGIFFIIRFSNIIENCNILLFIIIFLSSLTSIFASSVSLIQNDFKKIIAYSTCSQLGYMLLICGLSNYSLSLFHLFNHAFFKALLFLSSGLIIHCLFDEQDIRKNGSIIKNNPISSLFLITGNLALIGFPFMAGYYSKDLILEISLVSPLFIIILIINLIAAFFTATYSIRLFFYVYLKNFNGSLLNRYLLNRNNLFEIFSLLFLLVFSIIIGYYFKNLLLFDELILINNKLRYIPFIFCILSIFTSLIIINYYLFYINNFFSFIITSYLFNNIINFFSKII
jgi:NADH-ubiquinone oxidoreductase chain 5